MFLQLVVGKSLTPSYLRQGPTAYDRTHKLRQLDLSLHPPEAEIGFHLCGWYPDCC